jgi:hypothetical protein
VHDSDKEFFKLTLLSLQLNHKNFNLVKQIDTNSLYQEASENKLQFNNYHTFLKDQIDKFYLLKHKNVEPERFIGKEKELSEYQGAKIFVDMTEVKQDNEDSLF